MVPDPAATEAVRALLERCVAAWQDDGPAAAEAMIAAHPDLAGPVRDGLAALARAGFLDAERGDEARELPAAIGGYRVRELLGRGGMGAVFLAHDAAADRDVAIKVVHPQLLWYGRARERFQREVRALARLDHRGIVAIHQFGEDDGVPFFVMEHVRGASLAEVLAQVAGRDPADLTGRDLRTATGAPAADAVATRDGEPWWRVVVRLGAQVADALHYAHQREVVHRDVKPSNVLIDATGDARLVDFGLSRAAGESELTRSRTTIGSEPYMAPEQCGDGTDDVDGRADVFALGATLYETLSLRAPFGSGGAATRDRIRAGDFAPLQRLVRGVPRDLGAVLAVALDPDPRRRYASAGAFADDLRAVLDGGVVQARPLGVPGRLWRAARRRPVTAAAIALTALVLTVAPAAFAWQQYEAGQRVRGALARAEHNRDVALDAVGRLSGHLAQSRLLELPETEVVCREMLEDAVAVYEALLLEQPDDSSVRLEYATGRRRLADLRRWLGDHEGAERDNDEAVTVLRALGSEGRFGLAGALAAQARFAGLRGDHENAAALLRESIALLDELLAAGGSEERIAAVRRAAAERRIDLAGTVVHFGDDAAVTASLASAQALLRDLDADMATLMSIGRSLAYQLKASAGRLENERAMQLGEAAIAAYDRALELEPHDLAAASARASVRTDLSKLAFELRRVESAVAFAREAHAELGRLVGDHPRITWLRYNHLDAAMTLGESLRLVDRHDEAAARLLEVVEGCRDLAAEQPTVVAYRELLVLALGAHAQTLDDVAAARAEFEEALVLIERLLAEQADSPTLWQHAVATRMWLSNLARREGDHPGEVRWIDEAIAVVRDRYDHRRGSKRAVVRMLRAVLLDRADCAARGADPAVARAFLREARDLGATDKDVSIRPALAQLPPADREEPR